MKWLNEKMTENYISKFILDSDKNGEYIIYDSRQVVEVRPVEEQITCEIQHSFYIDEEKIKTPLEKVKWN